MVAVGRHPTPGLQTKDDRQLLTALAMAKAPDFSCTVDLIPNSHKGILRGLDGA